MRRASLSDRTNLYRKEYEGEAILWQQRSAAEDQRTSTYNGDLRETRTDQENKDPVSARLQPGPGVHCHGRGPGLSLALLLQVSAFRRRSAGRCPETAGSRLMGWLLWLMRHVKGVLESQLGDLHTVGTHRYQGARDQHVPA